MVSHETKRILGIGSLVLILIVLLVRILPVPFPGSHPFAFPRKPGGPSPYTPALILNGTGFVSFNWTAPASIYYSLVLENQNLSPWSSNGFLYTSPYSSCDIHVWDLNSLRVIFA